LKTWLAHRYPAVSATGANVGEMIANANKSIEKDAGTKGWLDANYKMKVLDADEAKTQMQTKYGKVSEQTVGMKNFLAPELRMLELAFQTFSDMTVDVIRNVGVAIGRQVAGIDTILGKVTRGKRAPDTFVANAETAGETFEHKGVTTILMYGRAWLGDNLLFSGEKVGSDVRATPLSAMFAIHEMGHALSTTDGAQAAFNKKFVDAKAKVHTASITWYAEKDRPVEFFPEAFAIYNQDPEWMRVNVPAMFLWFEEFAKTGKAPT
jgi:hypothetical protein